MMSNRKITEINFSITTTCNRSCPLCCYDTRAGNKRGGDIPLEKIIEYSKHFQTLEQITITGGEPSIHKQFVEFSDKIREIFPNARLSIETNGFGFTRTPEAFLNYDDIIATHYGEHTFPGCPSNMEDKSLMENYSKNTSTAFQWYTPQHIELFVGGGVCSRGLGGRASFFQGLIYGCCTAHGIPDAIGIKPTENWKEEILNVNLPCKNCMFAV